NLKWAAIVFLVLSFAVYMNIRDNPRPFMLYQLPSQFGTMITCIAGLMMGIVQSVFETKPDNWAYVVHRPEWRWRIFAAKCAAGLLLLYRALATPFLLAALWASKPGNLTMPFHASMMLPT